MSNNRIEYIKALLNEEHTRSLEEAKQELEKILSERENEEIRRDWAHFLSFTPHFVPEGFKDSPYYVEGDEDTPFVSEAFLYCLLGKDDGRTVLAYLRTFAEHMGIDMYELQAEVLDQ